MNLIIKSIDPGYSVKLDNKEISGFATDIKINIKPDGATLQLTFPLKENMKFDNGEALFQLLGNQCSNN